MANTVTPVDMYQLVNDLYQQSTGLKDLSAVDTATFASVAEKLNGSAQVMENTLNALTAMVGNTYFAIRPYRSKLSDILYVDHDRWGAIQRKISFISEGVEDSQDWNTNINENQLADGNSVDHYEINKPKVAEYVFKGSKVLQKHITRFRDQYALAFRSESDLQHFTEGYMQEFSNDIESINEAQTRATLLNYIGALYTYTLDKTSAGRAVDLRKAYNAAKDKSYTMAEIMNDGSVYQDFCQWFIVKINEDSEIMEGRTNLFNTTVTGQPILRQTPKPMQRLIFNTHFMDEIRARVFSTIFHPENLKIGDFAKIPYWQTPTEGKRAAISLSAGNTMSTTNGKSINYGATNIDHVVGVLYDRDALGVNYQFEYSASTPFNAAGGFWNLYMHWRKNFLNDFTENGILYYMSEQD